MNTVDLGPAAQRLGDLVARVTDAPAGPEVVFGPARLLPDGAPPLDRVVALAGRNPDWPA
jgi:hypothetical protein